MALKTGFDYPLILESSNGNRLTLEIDGRVYGFLLAKFDVEERVDLAEVGYYADEIARVVRETIVHHYKEEN